MSSLFFKHSNKSLLFQVSCYPKYNSCPGLVNLSSRTSCIVRWELLCRQAILQRCELVKTKREKDLESWGQLDSPLLKLMYLHLLGQLLLRPQDNCTHVKHKTGSRGPKEPGPGMGTSEQGLSPQGMEKEPRKGETFEWINSHRKAGYKVYYSQKMPMPGKLTVDFNVTFNPRAI